MRSTVQRVTRFSDLPWASELKEILVIGAGGINSYNIFNLSRINHYLTIFDEDIVDETNTIGGQLYRNKDIGKFKITAIQEICREFGCINTIDGIEENYKEEVSEYMSDICIMGVDNMEARKFAFGNWCTHVKNSKFKNQCLFMDGRLNAELYEVLTVCGNDKEAIEKYKQEYLFDDSEVEELACTAKQTSFVAMGISCTMVGTLCNWLTNLKMGESFRTVPFYNRFFLPSFKYDVTPILEEAIV